MEIKTIKKLEIGDKESFTKTVSEHDVYSFAGVTGDTNPVHINHEYAKETVFGKRIAHGILAVGFISTVLGTKLPGPGSIYVNQNCQFVKPVFIGDTITAMVEVTKKDEKKNRVWLRTYCTNQAGELVLEGEAIMMPGKEREKVEVSI